MTPSESTAQKNEGFANIIQKNITTYVDGAAHALAFMPPFIAGGGPSMPGGG